MFPCMRGTWQGAAVNCWLTAVEAAVVVPLRLGRIALGGKGAAEEAHRMVSEKFQANAELARSLAGRRLGANAEEMTYGVSRHYLRYVRANRKRLVRKLNP